MDAERELRRLSFQSLRSKQLRVRARVKAINDVDCDAFSFGCARHQTLNVDDVVFVGHIPTGAVGAVMGWRAKIGTTTFEILKHVAHNPRNRIGIANVAKPYFFSQTSGTRDTSSPVSSCTTSR